MIESLEIHNLGPVARLRWNDLTPINLLIGRHGMGKTFVLKALYCMVRALEEKRGDEPRSVEEILADKLYWTFQPDRLGDLVRRAGDEDLSVEVRLRDEVHVNAAAVPMKLNFGRAAEKDDVRFDAGGAMRDAGSIFLPAKEMLSLHHIILQSRDRDRLFGFDDTYYDLAKALSWPRRSTSLRGSADAAMARLQAQVGGTMEQQLNRPWELGHGTSRTWRLKSNGSNYPVGLAAEGARKVAALYYLFLNEHLGHNAIIFIDEPESALHPEAISAFMDVVAALREAFQGRLQFFIATHSYFVIKKLYLIAQQQGLSIPLAMAGDHDWQIANLRDGMPPNPIIDESIRLYEQEVDLALQ